jgi:hypothetical protein
MNPRVISVEYISPYKLKLKFNNNDIKQFDITPYLNYPVYHQLKNEAFCSTAKVFNNTVVWDDMIDFDPDTLYLESIKD